MRDLHIFDRGEVCDVGYFACMTGDLRREGERVSRWETSSQCGRVDSPDMCGSGGRGGYSTLSWERMCGPKFRPPPYN